MTTERKIYWGIGALSALIFAASFFTPGKPVSQSDLPWRIEHPAPGTTRIFDLTLGSSTPGDAERRFGEEAKFSLFKSPEGNLAAEGFFEQVTLAEMKARVVISLAIPEAELRGMYERGLRVSGVGSGKKIMLAPEDVDRARASPISGLTYMPSVRLDEVTIGKRFGQPARRIREKKSGTVHWLYPQNGLDIVLGDEGKPVLQYVPPKDFGKLLQPLLDHGEVIDY